MLNRAINLSFARKLYRAMFGLVVWAFALVAIAGELLPSYDRVLVLGSPRAISDAELTDQDGERFNLANLRGNVSLVFFGFTNCPDVCPIAMAKFQQLERSGLVEAESTNFILISVDGDRDTPDILKAYLEKYSSDFVGLTGNPRDVKKIAKEFRAPFFKGGEVEGYTVAHSTQAFALDRAGRIRAELHNPSIEVMAQVVNALSSESEAD